MSHSTSSVFTPEVAIARPRLVTTKVLPSLGMELVITIVRMGLSTLMITHDVDEAVSMASRIYVLSAGEGPGEPARISDEVEVGRAAGVDAGDFGLTPEFLAAKREVLSALGVG